LVQEEELTSITDIGCDDIQDINRSAETELILLVSRFIHYGHTSSGFDELLHIIQSSHSSA
jgi:hypothetical protein